MIGEKLMCIMGLVAFISLWAGLMLLIRYLTSRLPWIGGEYSSKNNRTRITAKDYDNEKDV